MNSTIFDLASRRALASWLILVAATLISFDSRASRRRLERRGHSPGHCRHQNPLRRPGLHGTPARSHRTARSLRGILPRTLADASWPLSLGLNHHAQTQPIANRRRPAARGRRRLALLESHSANTMGDAFGGRLAIGSANIRHREVVVRYRPAAAVTTPAISRAAHQRRREVGSFPSKENRYPPSRRSTSAARPPLCRQPLDIDRVDHKPRARKRQWDVKRNEPVPSATDCSGKRR